MSFDASDYAKQLYEIIHQKPKDDNKIKNLKFNFFNLK